MWNVRHQPSGQRLQVVAHPSDGPHRATPRVEFIDRLRALAALYVATYHALLIVWPQYTRLHAPPVYLRWADHGHFGVSAFIILSGYSLALRPANRGDHSVGGYGTFMKKRALRLLPPYWLALFGSVLLLALAPSGTHAASAPGEWSGKGAVPASSVFTFSFLIQDVIRAPSPNSPLWSVAVEWQLYFLFPLLLWVAGRYRLRTLVSASLLIAVPLHFVVLHTSAKDTTPQFVALFCFGISAAYVVAKLSRTAEAEWPSLLRVLGTTRGHLVGGAALVASWIVFMSMSHFEMAADMVSGAIFAAGLVMLGWASPTGRATSRNRVGRALSAVGLFSYSLYLVHAPTEKVVWTLFISHLHLPPAQAFMAIWVAGVGVSLLAAYSFFVVLERRSQEWSRRAGIRGPAPYASDIGSTAVPAQEQPRSTNSAFSVAPHS